MNLHDASETMAGTGHLGLTKSQDAFLIRNMLPAENFESDGRAEQITSIVASPSGADRGEEPRLLS